MNLVTVGGVALPTPSSYTALNVDIVDSGRNAQGVIVSNVIRHDVAKIEITWNFLTISEWAGVCSLFKTNFINSVRFLNQSSGAYETRNFYVGDRQPEGLMAVGGIVKGWKNCKLSLMEV